MKTSLGILTMALVAALAVGCAGDDGDKGDKGAAGPGGTTGPSGPTGPGGGVLPLPTLEGHIPGGHGYILAYDVQAAYNNDTFFWRVSYRGNEGKRHEYIRYTGGAWQREGGDRRDAQATIDGDPDQGDQTINSTIYEQRTTIMVNDPNAATAVTDFDKYGCFLTCHDDSRHMPEWTAANGHDGKYILPSYAPGVAAGEPVLDLWHWRGARSNPIARADDQNILSLDFPAVAKTGGDDGGRKGDAGTGVFTSNGVTGGNPDFVIDPTSAWGQFTFLWDDFWMTPFYYFTRPDAEQFGPTAPNPVTLDWATATAMGYTPMEGDVVPRRILRAGAGSRADVTAHGTVFIPESPDGSLGVWHVQMQRLLDTGNPDDIPLVDGNTYDVGFEVHLWEYTTRDHYVSFPMTLSLGTGTGDVDAIDVGGSGTFPLPDWQDTATIPVTRIYLFQPGISSWEFLTDANTAKTYTDPVTGLPVDQNHAGAGAITSGSQACADCHRVREQDAGGGSGSMEMLTRQRGGIWSDTPVD